MCTEAAEKRHGEEMMAVIMEQLLDLAMKVADTSVNGKNVEHTAWIDLALFCCVR